MATRSPSLIVLFLRQKSNRLQSPKSFDQTRNLAIGGGNNGGVGGVKQQEQISIDDKEFTDIAKQVCNVVRTRPRWEKTILLEYPLSTLVHPNCVLEIIKNQNNALLSFRFFHWLCSNDGFSPDSRCCNAIFDVLVQAKATKVAHSFICSVDFVPEPDTLESYVHCLCKDGDVNEARKVFSDLKSSGYSSSLAVCNAILSASVKAERTDFVWELYGEMMESGLVGDVDTVGYVILAFCKDDKFFEAYELLRQVLGSGIVPNVVVFTNLISGFCKKGMYTIVSDLLHLMIEKNCAPNIFTYQEIIYGLCKTGRVDEGFRVFNDLKERGYTPHRVMYTTMIDGLCKMKLIGDARKLWFEMLCKGFLPNENTYNVLIDGYWKTDDSEQAWKLWKEMCVRGLKRTTLNYNTMIAGLCNSRSMGKACFLFKEMPKMGIKRNVITFNTLIYGFCKLRNRKKAMEFYHKLHANGLQPSADSYTPLVKYFCCANRVQRASTLWNEMLRRGLDPFVRTPDRGYDLIILLLLRRGDVAEGMNRLATMLQKKLIPSEKTFNKIIKYLTTQNMLDDVLPVLHSMLGMGISLNTHVLYNLVGQLCKEKSDQAGSHLESILERKLKLQRPRRKFSS